MHAPLQSHASAPWWFGHTRGGSRACADAQHDHWCDSASSRCGCTRIGRAIDVAAHTATHRCSCTQHCCKCPTPTRASNLGQPSAHIPRESSAHCPSPNNRSNSSNSNQRAAGRAHLSPVWMYWKMAPSAARRPAFLPALAKPFLRSHSPASLALLLQAASACPYQLCAEPGGHERQQPLAKHRVCGGQSSSNCVPSPTTAFDGWVQHCTLQRMLLTSLRNICARCTDVGCQGVPACRTADHWEAGSSVLVCLASLFVPPPSGHDAKVDQGGARCTGGTFLQSIMPAPDSRRRACTDLGSTCAAAESVPVHHPPSTTSQPAGGFSPASVRRVGACLVQPLMLSVAEKA